MSTYRSAGVCSYSWACTHAYSVRTDEYEYSWQHTDEYKFPLTSDPALMSVSLITGLTFLVLPVLTQHNTPVFIIMLIKHYTKNWAQTNMSAYADLGPGISFARWQTQTANWLVSEKKKRGGGEVYEFDNSKYRCDIPTPLRPELKIKCAFIIWMVVPACLRSDQTRLHESHKCEGGSVSQSGSCRAGTKHVQRNFLS